MGELCSARDDLVLLVPRLSVPHVYAPERLLTLDAIS